MIVEIKDNVVFDTNKLVEEQSGECQSFIQEMLLNEINREYEINPIGQDYITKQYVYRPSVITYEKDGFCIDKVIQYTSNNDWFHTFVLINFRKI